MDFFLKLIFFVFVIDSIVVGLLKLLEVVRLLVRLLVIWFKVVGVGVVDSLFILLSVLWFIVIKVFSWYFMIVIFKGDGRVKKELFINIKIL